MENYYEIMSFANDERLAVEITGEGLYLGILDENESKTLMSFYFDTQNFDGFISSNEIKNSKYANSLLAEKISLFEELEELLCYKGFEDKLLDNNSNTLVYIDFDNLKNPNELLEVINSVRDSSSKLNYKSNFWYTDKYKDSLLVSILDEYEYIFSKGHIHINDEFDKYLFITDPDIDDCYAYNEEEFVGSINEIPLLSEVEELKDFRFKLSRGVASGEIKLSFENQNLKDKFLFHFMEMFEGRNYVDYIDGTRFNNKICFAPVEKDSFFKRIFK